MALPDSSVIRSYPGGAAPTYLSASLNYAFASGQTITVANTTGWYEVSAGGYNTTNPLGTSGPFTLVVDYGLGSEEKILCASGAISLGVNTTIFVYNVSGTNGRGYDGTTATSHSVGSSSDYNVFPVATAIEQAQFNLATSIIGNSTLVVSGTAAGGDLAGTYPNPTLKAIYTGDTFSGGGGSFLPTFSWDNAGRITNVSGINIFILTSAVSGLNTTISGLQTQINTNGTNINTQSGQINTQSGQINTQSGQINTQSGQINALFVTTSGQSVSISTLNSTVSGQTTNINSLNTQVSGLSTRIDNLSTTTDSGFASVNTQISGLNVVVSGQANTLATEANNIATLSGQYVTLSGNLVTTNSNVANLSGQFASLSGSYNTTSGIVTNQTGYIATLSGQMITANNGISTNASNLSTLSGSVATISGKQVTDEANIASLSGSLVTLSGQFVTTSGRTIFSGTTAGGDLTGTYPNPTLRTISGVSGTYGSATQTPLLSIDSNGRVTNAQLYTIQIAESQVNNLVTDMTSISGNIASVSGKQATDASNIATLSGQYVTTSGIVTNNTSYIATISGKQVTDEANIATLSGQYATTSGIVTNQASYIATISGKQVTDESNIASISGSLVTVSGVAYAALPRTGGTISGNLTVTGTLSVNSTNIALGANTPISSVNSAGVAIGNYAGQSSNNNGVAIGAYAGSTQNFDGVAIGYEAGYYYNEFGVSIGYLANINNTGSNYATAIGYQTNATAPGSVAIGTDHTGAGATSSTQDQIVLGTANHNVNVPGTLTVSGINVLTSISGVTAGGDLQGTYPNPTISTALSGTISTNTTNIATISGKQVTDESNIASISGSLNTTNSNLATLSGSTVTLGTTQTISGIKTFTGTTTFSGLTYYPTFPTGTYELANKQYVDAAVAQLNVHAPAFAGTTGNLTATYSGGTIDQDGGYGIGATLTSTTNAGFAIDSIAASGFVSGARILVKDQTTGTQNGVYVVTVTGSSSIPWKLTRASDYNDSISGQVTAGDFIFVQSGTVNANNGYIMASAGTGPNGDIVIGTDTIQFSQFSGAGEINAGGGLTKTGNTIDVVTANSSRIVVNPDSIDLATIGTSGTYGSNNNVSIITTDGYGRISNITTSGIQIAENQVTNLSGDLLALSGSITTTNSNLATLSGQYATTSGIVTTNTSSISTLSGQMVTANANIAATSGSLATLSGQYVSTSGIVTTNTSSIATLSGQMVTANSNIAATSGSLATLSGQFVTLSGSYNTTSGNLNTTNTNVANLSGQYATLSGQYATTSGNVTTNTSSIATLSGQVVTLSGSDANKLPLSGGTVTGTLNVNSPFNVNGNVSITGTETISGALNVNYTINATTPTTNPPINFGGGLSYSDVNIMAGFNNSVNNYNQVIVQNTNSGTSASTNLNVSNNLGTSGTNYGEFGMNSSNFTGNGAFNIAGAVYLASASTDLAIGTYGNNAIHFVTNNAANDAMTITSGGNVVVASGFTVSGTSTQIGNVSFSGAVTVSGSAVMTSGSAVGGDLTGTIGNAKVTKLQGYTVSSGAPTANAMLIYSGSQWVSGPVVSGTTGTGGVIPYATNPLLVAPLEQVVVSSGVVSSSAAAVLNTVSGGVYVYTAAPTSAWQIQITNAPTTVGQAVTVTVGTNNGSTAYLPSGFTINGYTVNGGTTLPAHGTAYTNTYTVTAYYQGGSIWTAADATVNYDFYAITLICTAANTYVMLLGQTKF